MQPRRNLNWEMKMMHTQTTRAKQQSTLYLGLGLLVGPGIDQKPHTLHVTLPHGTNQRRPFVLQLGFARRRPPLTGSASPNVKQGRTRSQNDQTKMHKTVQWSAQEQRQITARKRFCHTQTRSKQGLGNTACFWHDMSKREIEALSDKTLPNGR